MPPKIHFSNNHVMSFLKKNNKNLINYRQNKNQFYNDSREIPSPQIPLSRLPSNYNPPKLNRII